MPRYFFNIPAAGAVDHEGVELPNWSAVVDEATASAREILADGVIAGDEKQDWVMEVKDEGGRTVLTLRLADAVRAPKGDDRGATAADRRP